MLPLVIHETLTRTFKFYHDGDVRLGMSYRQQLYRLIEHYPTASRLQAYNLGCSLSHRNNQVVVTVSDRDYKVWLELRSQTKSPQLTKDSIEDNQIVVP
jgi:hypothetical protein